MIAAETPMSMQMITIAICNLNIFLLTYVN